MMKDENNVSFFVVIMTNLFFRNLNFPTKFSTKVDEVRGD